MADRASEVARNCAFCYFGLLRCAERFERILKILPEIRQHELETFLERAKSLSGDELTSRLRTLRERVHPLRELPNVTWNSLPPALQRCLSACIVETHGRENY